MVSVNRNSERAHLRISGLGSLQLQESGAAGAGWASQSVSGIFCDLSMWARLGFLPTLWPKST